MATPQDSDRWNDYATLAADYYVSARFAVVAGYVPLCGNMMHHAIELLLKCGLIKAGAVPSGVPVGTFLKKTYSHKLNKLWMHFKSRHSMAPLSRFDALIDALDPWEDIRYPKLGIHINVDFGPPVIIPGVQPPTTGSMANIGSSRQSPLRHSSAYSPSSVLTLRRRSPGLKPRCAKRRVELTCRCC